MHNTTPTVSCPVKDRACHPSLSTLPIPGFSKSWLHLLGVIKGSQSGGKSFYFSKESGTRRAEWWEGGEKWTCEVGLVAREVGDVMISVCIYECPLQRVGEGNAGVQTDGLRKEKDGFLL